jgi:outer membrane protein W
MRTKHWIVAVLLLCLTGLVYGQNMKALEIHVGTLNPKDTPSGMLLGGSYGISVDETVDISLGVFYFWKSYSETSAIDTGITPGGTHITQTQQTLDYHTSLLPVSANVTVHFPVAQKVNIYGGAGISYQFLWNKEENLVDDVESSRFFKGFGWVGRAGVEYLLGSRSSFIVEAYYNGCKTKGNKSEEAGLPTWDEVNVTGLGIRGGVRLIIF